MNTFPRLEKPENPVEGDSYYNMSDSSSYIYVDWDWHHLASTWEDTKNFMRIEGTKNPVIKIIDGNWLLDNIRDIKKWLIDTSYGEYSPLISSVLLDNEKAYTAFLLKYK